jgi:SAM-dependent methyltransferase
MPAQLHSCQICGATDSHPTYQAREMMHGLRDTFTYFECLHCGCLQISEIPADMSRYYPSHYYSMAPISPQKQGRLRRVLNRLRTGHALHGKPGVGALLRKVFGPPALAEYFSRVTVGLDSPILDVGCGSGGFLHCLHGLGFGNLTGIDPYLPHDSSPLPGLRILKRSPQQLTDTYDLICLHHSFEHMAEPLQVLQSLKQSLNPTGRLVIRIPICSSHAWQHYRCDWVALDPPRHFFLHSLHSMALLAQKADLAIESTSFDSWELQFWGSEQYRQDIPLFDERSWNNGPAQSIFTTAQIEAFRQQAEQLNAQGLGDQACFILRRQEAA